MDVFSEQTFYGTNHVQSLKWRDVFNVKGEVKGVINYHPTPAVWSVFHFIVLYIRTTELLFGQSTRVYSSLSKQQTFFTS